MGLSCLGVMQLSGEQRLDFTTQVVVHMCLFGDLFGVPSLTAASGVVDKGGSKDVTSFSC